MNPLESARWWVKHGFHPIPLPNHSKKPVVEGWQKLRLPEAELPRYFNGQAQNIGVILGDDHGTADADLDCPEAIAAGRELLPETALIFGRKSAPFSHYFYRSDPPIRSRKYLDPLGTKETIAELRCQKIDGTTGMQTVVPASTHDETGEQIRFESGCDGHPANIEAPVLQAAIAKTAAAALLARYFPKPKAGRNDAFLALAGTLARAGWSVEDATDFNFAIYRVLWGSQAVRATCVSEVRPTFEKYTAGLEITGIPKLKNLIDERAVKAALEWLEIDTRQQVTGRSKTDDGKSPADLLRPLLNDYGNAERLVALHGDELRYCHAFRKWLVYDGRRWEVDTTGRASRLAKDAMLRTYQAAVEARNEPVEKFARLSLSARSIANMLSMAEPEIFVTPDKLDQDGWALNFLNGTVDLRTGELRAHRREDFITKVIEFEYKAEAACPLFLATLHRLMGGGPDASEPELERAERLVSHLQKAFGYSATAVTSEKVVFVPYGGGNNGKTTMLATIAKCLREYSGVVLIDSIMSRQETSNAQADLADLRGARFVMTSETEEGQRLAEGKLKRITQGVAGGKIKAVRKYENPVEFTETHKLWMDCNHKPVVRGTDAAIWNRIHLIPFTVTIPAEEIDRELPTKLMAEVEGILAWVVAGAVRWHHEGLGKPPEVADAVREYRAEMDQIGRFIDECCVPGDYASARGRELYTAYRKWAEESGEHFVTEMHLGLKLKERGFVKRHKESGVMYEGIGLRT